MIFTSILALIGVFGATFAVVGENGTTVYDDLNNSPVVYTATNNGYIANISYYNDGSELILNDIDEEGTFSYSYYLGYTPQQASKSLMCLEVEGLITYNIAINNWQLYISLYLYINSPYLREYNSLLLSNVNFIFPLSMYIISWSYITLSITISEFHL